MLSILALANARAQCQYPQRSGPSEQRRPAPKSTQPSGREPEGRRLASLARSRDGRARRTQRLAGVSFAPCSQARTEDRGALAEATSAGSRGERVLETDFREVQEVETLSHPLPPATFRSASLGEQSNGRLDRNLGENPHRQDVDSEDLTRFSKNGIQPDRFDTHWASGFTARRGPARLEP